MGVVFVYFKWQSCHGQFCKVPLFSNGIKGCFFCWVPLVLAVFDGAVFGFFRGSYVDKKYS